ncbi:capsid protein [Labrenzia sp. R4_2]|uniref:capsid protein n=1 Tax=Labrenzia sp. R4_2 TaxID=2821107 RepID=UPI001AD98983|nr:capsid protein [Labrenzia sp. R4_2]MBO9421714.1 capsid protein [Labrenzia sp. R4_2]
MSSATEQFTESPVLTAIAIAYSNPDYSLIADQVLPRVPSSGTFKYQVYDEAEAFTLPDTRVGRRSAPNQVEIEGTEQDGSTEEYGIDVPLDNKTIAEAKKNKWDPEKRAAERATDIVLLDREVRTANLIKNPANYHADHVEALAGADMFTDPNSDPVTIIEDLMATCWQRPNQITFGFGAWMAFRKHPKVVKAVHANSGDQGRASHQQVADLLEVKRILVGESRVNIKRPGEDPVLARVWDNIVSGQFINKTADTSGGITFGYTAQNGKKVAGTMSANMGLRGGKLVRSGEDVRELIVARRAGFLIQNAA